MKTAVTPVRILKARSVPACRLLMVNRVCLITVARLERAVHAWCSWRAALHVCRRLPILIKTGRPPPGPFPLGAQLCLMPLLLFSDRSSVFLLVGIPSLSLSLAHSPRSEQSTNVEKGSLIQKLLLLLLCGYPLSLSDVKTTESTGSGLPWSLWIHWNALGVLSGNSMGLHIL